MSLPPSGCQPWEHRIVVLSWGHCIGSYTLDYLVVTSIGPISHTVISHLSNDLCQPRVTQNQPAPRGDAIGLVLELVRLQLIKVLEAAG